MDQQSRRTSNHVQDPAESTSCPGRFGPGSEVPCCRTTFPHDSQPCPRRRGVHHLSQETRAPVPGTSGSTRYTGRPVPGFLCRGVNQMSRVTWVRVRIPAWSTSCPGRLTTGSFGLWCRPTLPDDSQPCHRSRGVNQLSWATWALVPGPRAKPDDPGDLGLGSCVCVVDQLYRGTRVHVLVPVGRPAVPGDSGPGLRCLGVV